MEQELLNTFKSILDELRKLNKLTDAQRHNPSTPLRLKELAIDDCARYILDTYPDVLVYKVRQETLRYALGKVKLDGLFLEFGVNSGETINLTAKERPDARIFGFDSFKGLPEDWSGTGLAKGAFDRAGNIPAVADNVELVHGWFNESVPVWKQSHPEKIAFCHVDCDLYSSTVTIFTELECRFEKGTIIVFDEYFGYPDWRNGEHKAFMEMLERTGFTYKALAISHMALVVELT